VGRPQLIGTPLISMIAHSGIKRYTAALYGVTVHREDDEMISTKFCHSTSDGMSILYIGAPSLAPRGSVWTEVVI